MTRATAGADKLRLAEVALASGRFAEAIALLRTATRLDRDSPRPGLMLAYALSLSGEAEEAIQVVRRVIQRSPANGDAWFNLGNLYRAARRFDEALHAFKRAALLQPDNAGAHINLGYVLVQLGKFAEAEEKLRWSLQRFPAEPDLLANLAQIQRATYRLNDALASLDRCVAMAPGHAGYRVTRAMVLRDLGRKDQALTELDSLIADHPHFPDAHSARAQVHLSRGEYAAAWADFLWRPERARWLLAQGKPANTPPLTLGDLRGRPVVLCGEQGLGDVIFFLRFAPLVAEVASSVHLSVNPRLLSILPKRWCLPAGPDAVSILVGDLGAIFGSKPVPSLQLAPDPELRERVLERLSRCGPRPYLGVTWQGGFRWEDMPEPGSRLFKRVPPSELGQALSVTRGTLISLQRGSMPEDLKALSSAAGRQVHDFSEVNENLAEALALLSAIDDYVAVSNTNVHFNDAIGKRTRVLVTHPAEWRWSMEGDRSPWLTGALLYRQDMHGSWRAALARLQEDLTEK